MRAIAASGATSVTPLVLHLRPGAREWYMAWLARHHPHLVRRYERLYADGAYAPKWYQRQITRQVHELAQEYGIGPRRAELPRRTPVREPAAPEPAVGHGTDATDPALTSDEHPTAGASGRFSRPDRVKSGQNAFFRRRAPGRCDEGRGVHGPKSSVLGGLTMKKRAAALCGAAAVLAGMVTAVPAGASGASAAAPAAKPAWKKCATGDYPTLQCASLKVPLDHTKPNGQKITLALSRVPHTAKKYQGPLLVNPGGPGGSGLTLAGFVASSLPKKVAAQYDVIGFDPRGVGTSKPALELQAGPLLAGAPRLRAEPPAKIEQANLKRARAFADACAKKYADVLPYIDTVSAVRDMDAIRAALGAKKINYFGYSYGTYLGAVYAKLFPNRVRRLVLDSVVDPTGVWYDDNLRQDHAFNDRHRALMAWVAEERQDVQAGHRSGEDRGQVVRDAGGARQEAGRTARWAPPSWRTPSCPAATTTATGPISPRRSPRS